jgi:hypothetical protein
MIATDELQVWKIVAYFKALPRHSPEGTKETNEKPQGSRTPGRDSNPATPECEAGMLLYSNL